jgi:hypothetical protein
VQDYIGLVALQFDFPSIRPFYINKANLVDGTG